MLRYLCFLLLFTLCACQDRAATGAGATTEGQVRPVNYTADPESPPQRLYATYERYQEKSLRTRRFKHEDIVPLIQRLGPAFQVSQAGSSIENRAIYRVTYGSGPVKVLLWSQMHGDEPTATQALFDIFNFLSAGDDEFTALRQRLQRELTLVFLPMLNPDGASRNVRRNALGIDLNRDALRLATPEAQILKNERDRLRADWGFNLHDQSRYYGAGYPSEHTATLSFLAPAYNWEKDVNETRGNAMRLIGRMKDALDDFIPGRMARYDDAFEPRAFGDNVQKWGTSTILIESGAYPGDPEKQYVRKMNYIGLLVAFDAIAGGAYRDRDYAAYESLPFNESNLLHDLILREVEVLQSGKWYKVDIGYRLSEVDYDGNRRYYYRASISDLGDLSFFPAFTELPPSGLRAEVGKVYDKTIADVAALKQLNPRDLLRQGYTTVRMAKLPSAAQRDQLPLQLIDGDDRVSTNILPGLNPSLVLKKDGQVQYAVINGILHKVDALDLAKWRALK